MNAQDVINEVRRLANERPDYVYERADLTREQHEANNRAEEIDEPYVCRYIEGDKGSCIFGQALVNLGVSAGILAKYEGRSAEHVVMGLFGNDPVDQQQWMRSCQAAQDRGETWRDAVMEADRA